MKSMSALLWLLPLLTPLEQVEAQAVRGGQHTISSRVHHVEASSSASVAADYQYNVEDFLQWEYGQPELLNDNNDRRLITFNVSDGNSTLPPAQQRRGYRFAILPMTKAGRYGTMITRGCKEGALRLQNQLRVPITCDAYGSETDANVSTFFPAQNESLHEILANATSSDTSKYYYKYDAIAVSANIPDAIAPLLNQAHEAGIHVVTFDTDVPQSQREAFVATNNTFLGTQLANVLHQLAPEGGTFAAIWPPLGPSYEQRLEGFRSQLLENSDGVWSEFPNSPASAMNVPQFWEIAEEFCQQENPPAAIAIMVYPPFMWPGYEALVDRYRHKNITWIGVGGTDRQMDLLSRKYVHGLVSQLHYEMGFVSLQNMATLARGNTIAQEVVATNVVTHIQVPIVLPELKVDPNRVGQLAVLGYAFFAITSLTGFAFAAWVWVYRRSEVVRASQPIFLLMVAIGMVIMSSASIPLGLDDSHERANPTAICMSPPWLLATGFATAFSALFSKTRRVNKMFKAGSQTRRIQVKNNEVFLQFLTLLGLNIIVLVCWTVIDPLAYKRVDNPGTDGWNRIIATRGTCQCSQLAPYVIPLVLINMACLAVANWQAYRARFIQSEFAEAKYIGIACVSMFQTALVGIPILLVVQDQPQALYLVMVSMIFVVSMAVLLLIFVPKMVLMENYTRSTEQQKQLMMKAAIRESTLKLRRSSLARSSSGVNSSGHFSITSGLNDTGSDFGSARFGLTDHNSPRVAFADQNSPTSNDPKAAPKGDARRNFPVRLSAIVSQRTSERSSTETQHTVSQNTASEVLAEKAVSDLEPLPEQVVEDIDHLPERVVEDFCT